MKTANYITIPIIKQQKLIISKIPVSPHFKHIKKNSPYMLKTVKHIGFPQHLQICNLFIQRI